jgi:hypothetical protein
VSAAVSSHCDHDQQHDGVDRRRSTTDTAAGNDLPQESAVAIALVVSAETRDHARDGTPCDTSASASRGRACGDQGSVVRPAPDWPAERDNDGLLRL